MLENRHQMTTGDHVLIGRGERVRQFDRVDSAKVVRMIRDEENVL